MSSEFRPATAADLDAIAGLLRSAFHAAPDAPFLDRTLLEWKYFAPGPEWNGARSYVFFQDGSLAAHGCAWPVRLRCNEETFTALTLIDWASVRSSPGAGFQLVRKMASLTDVVISIGGSPATRHIMPRIGFRVVQEETLYARVLRPWRQFRTRPGRATWREVARLVRNTGYALGRRASSDGWSAHSAAAIDPQVLSDSLPAEGPASLRRPEFLEYMTRCPGTRIGLHGLTRNGVPSGYAALSEVNHQARIAEMRISSREPDAWNRASSTLLQSVSQSSTACELIVWASDPRWTAALQANGFRPRGRRSIFVYDPRNLIGPADGHWSLSMLDDDSAFLNVPEYPYAT